MGQYLFQRGRLKVILSCATDVVGVQGQAFAVLCGPFHRFQKLFKDLLARI